MEFGLSTSLLWRILHWLLEPPRVCWAYGRRRVARSVTHLSTRSAIATFCLSLTIASTSSTRLPTSLTVSSRAPRASGYWPPAVNLSVWLVSRSTVFVLYRCHPRQRQMLTRWFGTKLSSSSSSAQPSTRQGSPWKPRTPLKSLAWSGVSTVSPSLLSSRRRDLDRFPSLSLKPASASVSVSSWVVRAQLCPDSRRSARLSNGLTTCCRLPSSWSLID